jgi:hypothetical protein
MRDLKLFLGTIGLGGGGGGTTAFTWTGLGGGGGGGGRITVFGTTFGATFLGGGSGFGTTFLGSALGTTFFGVGCGFIFFVTTFLGGLGFFFLGLGGVKDTSKSNCKSNVMGGKSFSANIFSAIVLAVLEGPLDFVAAKTGIIPLGFWTARAGGHAMAIKTSDR